MIKTFYKPTSLEEALLLKEKHENLVAWFAGGTHINHFEFKAHYDQVISLEGLGLFFIHTKTNQTSVGAMVTLQKLADNSLIPECLRWAAFMAAPRTIRNMATVGGDIATGGKGTRLTPCLMALNAVVETADGKTQPIEDYVSQDSKELILKIIIPSSEIICVAKQLTLKANGPVLASTAVSMKKTEDPDLKDVVVAIGTIEGVPRRLEEIEKGVIDQTLADRESIEKAVADVLNPESDQFGSRDYKKHITSVAIADSIISCLERG
ncbi:FAD binding domain-containing protein [bacterium]|nr:FAD binding domain-containing protein [bacterium]